MSMTPDDGKFLDSFKGYYSGSQEEVKRPRDYAKPMNRYPTPTMPKAEYFRGIVKDVAMQYALPDEEIQFDYWHDVTTATHIVKALRSFIGGSPVTAGETCPHCGIHHTVETYNVFDPAGDYFSLEDMRRRKVSAVEFISARPMHKDVFLDNKQIRGIAMDYIQRHPNMFVRKPEYLVPATAWDAWKVAIRRTFPRMTAPFWTPRYTTV